MGAFTAWLSGALASEGAHNVHGAATDVAGNIGTSDVVVRVDTAPPSKPALTRPFSVTSSTTPTFRWGASAPVPRSRSQRNPGRVDTLTSY